jgi:hypothetical protein
MDQVEGSVRYDDGSLIPSQAILIRFEPLTPPLSERVHPKAGMAKVDPVDGTFRDVTTFKFGDGIVRGRHKVLLSERSATVAEDDPKALIPSEYRNPQSTPLEVDSQESPFEFKIPKPRRKT